MIKTIDGIQIEIIKKNIRSVRLVVKKDGSVYLSCPVLTGENTINRFLSDKKEWLIKTVAKIKNKQVSLPQLTDEANCVFVFGKKYNLVFVPDKKESFFFGADKMYILSKHNFERDKKQALVQKYLKKILSDYIDRRLPYYESFNRKCSSGYTIKNMSSRWGSCNIKTYKLAFSLRLVYYPEDCTDFVIAHELTHLYFAGHGELFKRQLSILYPNWRIVRQRLNNYNFTKGSEV